MRLGLAEKTLANINQTFMRYQNVKKVVVFGSRARGDYQNNSDIDLAVYAEGGLPFGLWSELDEAAGIYKIDLVDMTNLHNEKLKSNIETQGVKIFGQ
jgi:predicted nucleotidyltransferase